MREGCHGNEVTCVPLSCNLANEVAGFVKHASKHAHQSTGELRRQRGRGREGGQVDNVRIKHHIISQHPHVGPCLCICISKAMQRAKQP